MDWGDDESGRSDAESDIWLPFGQDGDLWQQESAYVATPPERARRRGMIAGIVFLGVVITGGGGAFGADAYATQAICAAVGRTSPARAPDGAARNAAVALDHARRTLDDTAALLFFHPELREATHDLAHDLADLQRLQDADELSGVAPGGTGLLVVAVSVDTHARQAQTACGLPVEGVRNATSVPRVSTSTTPASPTAVHVSPPTRHAAHPSRSSTRPTPPASAPSSAPSSAPAFVVTAGELRTAERMVAVTAWKDHLALVSPTASDAERQVTSYEHAAAVQHLTDLRAGTPNVRHHALDVRGARARLAAAEEDYRRAMIDPTVSPLDRSQARAVVEQWNETLTSLAN